MTTYRSHAATIPADGRWHELPERPVWSIHIGGPYAGFAMIDIDGDGRGRVRCPPVEYLKELAVEYDTREP